MVSKIGKLKLEEIKWLIYDLTVLSSDGCGKRSRSSSSQPNTFFSPLCLNSPTKMMKSIQPQMASWINFFSKCKIPKDKFRGFMQADLVGALYLRPCPLILVSTTNVSTTLEGPWMCPIKLLHLCDRSQLAALTVTWGQPVTQPFWFCLFISKMLITYQIIYEFSSSSKPLWS